MPDITNFEPISGVQIVDLTAHGDSRGKFIETFRKEWFPQRDFANVQMNASYSMAGVVRGLHYHHKQIDYWFLVRGAIRVGLYDLRPSSDTHQAVETIDLSADNPKGLFIPIGVAHGFSSKSEMVLTYLVDNYYDGSDENGLAWDDPDIGIDWGIGQPIVSERDAESLKLKDIDPAKLPQ